MLELKKFKSAEIKAILGNTLWLSIEKIFRMGLGFFVLALIVRYLGPEQFGNYSYILAFVALFDPLLNLIPSSIIVKDLVQKKYSEEIVLGTVTLVRFLGALTSLFLINIISFTFANHSPELRLLAFIMSFDLFVRIFESLDAFYQSEVKAKFSVYAKLIALTLSALFRVVLVVGKFPISYFIFACVLESSLFIGGFVLLYLKVYHKKPTLWKFDKVYLKEVLKISLAPLLSSVAITIYMKINQVMLKNMADAYQAGLFGASTKITELWYFIPLAISASFFPSIVALKTIDQSHYWSRLRRLFSLMTFTALTISVTMTFFGDLLIHILFSSKYSEAIPVFQIHIWTCLFVFWGVMQNAWDITENLLHLSLIRNVLAAFTNVSLNFILIPHYGAIGAAWAAVISYGGCNWIFNLFHEKTRKIFVLELYSFFPYFLKNKI